MVSMQVWMRFGPFGVKKVLQVSGMFVLNRDAESSRNPRFGSMPGVCGTVGASREVVERRFDDCHDFGRCRGIQTGLPPSNLYTLLCECCIGCLDKLTGPCRLLDPSTVDLSRLGCQPARMFPHGVMDRRVVPAPRACIIDKHTTNFAETLKGYQPLVKTL